MSQAAAVLVALFAVYLVGLGVAGLLASERIEPFLRGFAATAVAHYAEQVLRLMVGAALILNAPLLRLSVFVEVLGWLLAISASALLLLPWQLHQRFAKWAVPFALRRVRLFGAAALGLGVLLAWAMVAGPA